MSEAEELAERLEEMSECLASSSSRRTGRAAADLIRSQAVRIAELERRQIKVRWEGELAYVGVYPIGRIGLRANGKWGTSNIRSGEIGEAATESEARAAVESAAVKMMGGE